MFLSSCYSSFIVNYFKQIGFLNFGSDLLLTVVGVFGPMFCLSDSRVMIPIINLFGFKVSYCILLVLQIIVVVAIAGAGRDDELFSL